MWAEQDTTEKEVEQPERKTMELCVMGSVWKVYQEKEWPSVRHPRRSSKTGNESTGFRKKGAGGLEESGVVDVQGPAWGKRRWVVGWERRREEHVVAAGWGPGSEGV